MLYLILLFYSVRSFKSSTVSSVYSITYSFLYSCPRQLSSISILLISRDSVSWSAFKMLIYSSLSFSFASACYDYDYWMLSCTSSIVNYCRVFIVCSFFSAKLACLNFFSCNSFSHYLVCFYPSITFARADSRLYLISAIFNSHFDYYYGSIFFEKRESAKESSIFMIEVSWFLRTLLIICSLLSAI